MKQTCITLIICLAAIGVLGCKNGKTEESRKQRETQAEHQRTQQAVEKLAKAHDAVVNWRQGISGLGVVGRVYSAQLLPALVRPDGRPLLFIADALDVSPTGKDYQCSFQADVNASRSIRLILACTPEQATQIIHDREGRYAIVARVTSLGSAVPKPDEDDYEKEHAWFPAYGECLGEVNVGKDYTDDLMEMISLPDNKTNQ